MNQETVNAMYEKLDALRDVFEVFLDEHDTPEGEEKVNAIIAHLSVCIESLSAE